MTHLSSHVSREFDKGPVFPNSNTTAAPIIFSGKDSFMIEVQRVAWETPQIEEIGLGFEITAYVNDSEFGR